MINWKLRITLYVVFILMFFVIKGFIEYKLGLKLQLYSFCLGLALVHITDIINAISKD